MNPFNHKLRYEAKITQHFFVEACHGRNFHCVKKIQISFIPSIGITLDLSSSGNLSTHKVTSVFLRPDGSGMHILVERITITPDQSPRDVSQYMEKNGWISTYEPQLGEV